MPVKPYIYSDGELLTAEKLNNSIQALASAITNLAQGKIYANGRWYDTTGVYTMHSSWNYISLSGEYVATARLPHPFTPPAGYKFTWTIEETTGYTFLSVTAGNDSNSLTARIKQVGSSQANQLQKLRWFLVKA